MGVVVSPARKVADHRQGLVQRHAAFQRALPGQLDRRAVGHRVGEGHAQLDDIDARGRQALHDRQRGCHIGIAAHDIGDEGLFAGRLQAREGVVDSGHVLSPPAGPACSGGFARKRGENQGSGPNQNDRRNRRLSALTPGLSLPKPAFDLCVAASEDAEIIVEAVAKTNQAAETRRCSHGRSALGFGVARPASRWLENRATSGGIARPSIPPPSQRSPLECVTIPRARLRAHCPCAKGAAESVRRARHGITAGRSVGVKA